MQRKRLNRGLRVTFIGLTANTMLAASKLVAGLAGHSYALVADAVESLGDILSSIIVWRGLTIASVPADKDHPYGHGKAEPIAAAVVSTMLLLAAAGITVQAVREIISPHHAPAPFTLVVLVVVIITKEMLFRYVLRVGDSIASSAVCTDAWHHRSDAMTSLAAAVGISTALIGGPGYESADDFAAVVAAGIIAWNGWRLLRGAMNELMDIAPDEDLNVKISQVASGVDGVAAVEKCVVRKMGYSFYVDMHVEVDGKMSVNDAHAISHRVKDQVRACLPAVSDVLVHIEPSK